MLFFVLALLSSLHFLLSNLNVVVHLYTSSVLMLMFLLHLFGKLCS